jgi:hypothetical protein
MPVISMIPNLLHAEDLIQPPAETFSADFAQAWELIEGKDIELVAANNDIPSGYAESFGAVYFRNAKEIDKFFTSRVNSDFINFFNSHVAGKADWVGKRIIGNDAPSNFRAYWNAATSNTPVNLVEFISYMSVFINEIGGNLRSRTETFGNAQHPGISYLFDDVIITSPGGRKWRKASYNSRDWNDSLLVSLNNDFFLRGKASDRFYDALRYTSDPAWAGGAYPLMSFPTSSKPSDTGIILGGDFFKFRGRGLIQTTWRTNYRSLAERIISNPNASSATSKFAASWKGLSPNEICTSSSSADWDELFNDPDRVLLTEAVKLHAEAGNYLPLATTSSELNGRQLGSIVAMGNGIGGGQYGLNLKARVRQICIALGSP